jgi:TetR/AcrR family transcriptional regulator, copper-responsive repressor
MSRGRPRQFDPEAVLDHAVAIFLRDGFERASVQELAECMGICKPSLYAAFGNKEALFLQAMGRYASSIDAHRTAVLEREPTGRQAVEALLRATASQLTSGAITGCLIVSEAAAAPTGQSPEFRAALADAMSEGTEALLARIAQAKADGELAEHADPAALASYFGLVMSGMAVQARAGVSTDELLAPIDLIMRVWDTAATS